MSLVDAASMALIIVAATVSLVAVAFFTIDAWSNDGFWYEKVWTTLACVAWLTAVIYFGSQPL